MRKLILTKAKPMKKLAITNPRGPSFPGKGFRTRQMNLQDILLSLEKNIHGEGMDIAHVVTAIVHDPGPGGEET